MQLDWRTVARISPSGSWESGKGGCQLLDICNPAYSQLYQRRCRDALTRRKTSLETPRKKTHKPLQCTDALHVYCYVSVIRLFLIFCYKFVLVLHILLVLIYNKRYTRIYVKGKRLGFLILRLLFCLKRPTHYQGAYIKVNRNWEMSFLWILL